jgi:uncharacterized protein YbaR (Trm112 family)
VSPELVELLTRFDNKRLMLPRTQLEQIIAELRSILEERVEEKSTEDPEVITCPKCKRPLRVKVEKFLDIPVSLYGKLSKQAMRSKDVRSEGTNWPKASLYCPAGHFYLRGDMKGNGK